MSKLRLLPIFMYNSAAYVRLNRIKQKRIDRESRLKKAIDYLDEWEDIPISQLYGSVCNILKIKNNQAARSFIMSLNFGRPDLEETAKKLPLI